MPIQQVIHGDDHEIGVWPTRKYDRPADQPAHIAAADRIPRRPRTRRQWPTWQASRSRAGRLASTLAARAFSAGSCFRGCGFFCSDRQRNQVIPKTGVRAGMRSNLKPHRPNRRGGDVSAEPGVPSYTIRPFCPTSADGLRVRINQWRRGFGLGNCRRCAAG